MRINENQLISDLLYSIGQSRQSVDTLQAQISSGKLVNRPSDDPVLMQRLMLLQDQVNQNSMFRQNAGYAVSFLSSQSGALDQSVQLLTQIKGVILSAANDQNSSDQNAYASRLDEFIDQLLDLANTKFGDRYVFGGRQTTVQPFVMKSDRSGVLVNPEGVDGTLQVDIGYQMKAQYNITGAEAFSNGQIFSDLIAIRNKMKSGAAPSQGDIETIDSYLNQMISTNAKAGSMINRFQLIEQQLSSESDSLKSTISALGDTDIAAAVIQLQQKQIALNAALQTGAGIIQLSLANFLK
ncbi:MAG: flagellar hook-associated protein FlgL [Candidatus Kryptoniota bacterium]